MKCVPIVTWGGSLLFSSFVSMRDAFYNSNSRWHYCIIHAIGLIYGKVKLLLTFIDVARVPCLTRTPLKQYKQLKYISMAIRSFTCISDVTRRLPTGRAYWISGSQVLYRLAAFLSRHSRAPPAGCTEYSAQSMMCPSSGEGGAWDCGDPFLSFHAVQRGRHLL